MVHTLLETSGWSPGVSGFRWLRFAIKPHRLPATSGSEELPFSLVAYIYDPLDNDGGDETTNSNMTERRFNVVEAARSFVPIPQIMLLLLQ